MVTKIGEPQSDQEWEVAVMNWNNSCDGPYREGLRTILESYLADLPTYPMRYGSTVLRLWKSHLVRVLDFLGVICAFRWR